MRRSTLADGLLLTAVLVSTISVFALLRAIPGECPSVDPGKIEAPSAPCLASDRTDLRPSERIDASSFSVPAQPNRPIVMDSDRGLDGDVESTGSIPQKLR
jgi:hypothetical protein